MKWLGLVVWMMAFVACNNNAQNNEENEEEDTAFSYTNFSERFKAATLPYQLSDSGLLKNEDTAALRNPTFSSFIPDSIKQKLVGKGSNIKYVPLAKIEVPKGESYFIVKAMSGNRKAAMLTVFDKEKNYSTSFPFLVPDEDAATNQASSIDKAYSISRNVARKTKDDIIIDGKDVYVFNADAKDFTLIMTDLLDESNQELINPIDTFARTNKLAGDYVKDKRNIVSVRDGRNPNELTVFIHFEKNKGECTGELKGDVLMTSSKTAVYRQGGDPCVLELQFGKSSVTLREVEGCGSHRDVTCLFEGTFPLKKEEKDKSSTKKGKK
jgi:hypothetical protein